MEGDMRYGRDCFVASLLAMTEDQTGKENK